LFKVLILNSILIDLDKSPYRAIVGSFDVIRKQAGGKLLHVPVILEAFAADAFAAAWLPGAVAILHVFFAVTFFHAKLPQ
jgi:hypothetical protein